MENKIQNLKNRVENILTQEQITKPTPVNIELSRFRQNERFIEEAEEYNALDIIKELAQEHLKVNSGSLSARYFLGSIAYKENDVDNLKYFRELIDSLKQAGRWALVEFMGNIIINYGDSRFGFRTIASALEKLGRMKEAVPYLERLVFLDKTDVNTLIHLAEYLNKNNEQRKAVNYYLQAAEYLIENHKVEKVEDIVKEIADVTVDFDKNTILEKIADKLIKNKEISSAVIVYHKIISDNNNYDYNIRILKQLLSLDPKNERGRKLIAKFYKLKYSEHSKFDEFFRLAGFENPNKDINTIIADFEKHISFDEGNYVLHRSWGIGKLKEFIGDRIKIDFDEKKDHLMSLSMAMKALEPVSKEHYQVQLIENRDALIDKRDNNPLELMKVLMNSYGNEMSLKEIKEKLSLVIAPSDWIKWWNKTLKLIKSSVDFGKSREKANTYFIRSEEISFEDELFKDFILTHDFNRKLEIFNEFLTYYQNSDKYNNYLSEIISEFSKIYNDTHLKKISGNTLYNEDLVQVSKIVQIGFVFDQLNEMNMSLSLPKRIDIVKYLKDKVNSADILFFIEEFNYKKGFLEMFKKSDNWAKIYASALSQKPLRLQNYIFNELVRNKKFTEINSFIADSFLSSKSNTYAFLYILKNIVTENWQYEWLNYSEDELFLTFIKLIATERNTEDITEQQLLDMLFKERFNILAIIIERASDNTIYKIIEIINDSSILEDNIKNKIIDTIQLKRNIEIAEKKVEEELSDEYIYVTREGLNKKSKEYQYLLDVEIPQNSKDIGEAASKGDLSENADYKFALEKQSILKGKVEKMKEELDKVKVIEELNITTDKIGIGNRVKLRNHTLEQDETYILLGPWDVDIEKGIISYNAPLGQMLRNRKIGDRFILKLGSNIKEYEVLTIEKWI